MVKDMKNNEYLKGTRTDLAIDKIKNITPLYTRDEFNVYEIPDKKNIYHILTFKDLLDSNKIKELLKKEIKFFLNKMISKKNYHVFIVGLGNENNTADSIGPKVIKNININSHLKDLGIDNNIIISALEPGVLGQTGIETSKIIKSVTKEIKPDIIVIIDSYVTENIDFLNKSIQITNEGIIPGSGLKIKNDEISCKTLNIPVLVIGIPTAIEIIFENKKESKIPYLVSTKDVDLFVLNISKIISESLNEVFTF